MSKSERTSEVGKHEQTDLVELWRMHYNFFVYTSENQLSMLRVLDICHYTTFLGLRESDNDLLIDEH